MSFAAPFYLLALVIIPVAVLALRLLDERRDGRSSAWAAPTLLPNMVTRPPALRRWLPTALLLVGASLLLVGFARPKATFAIKKQDATVVLVLDVSGSMAARDSQPTRLGAAKKIALDYVDRLPKGYRMSVITFSDHTSVVAAPTHDLLHVRSVIENARTGPQGTALADAVAHAVQVAKTVRGPAGNTTQRPPAVVVLISDGGQTAGRVTPQQAAAAAKNARIPVSAVGLGTPDGIVLQQLKGGFTERIQVPTKPDVLKAIATASGGRFYAGANAVDVHATYAELGSRVGKKNKQIEVTAATAAGGLVFMLAGAVLSGVWFRRLV